MRRCCLLMPVLLLLALNGFSRANDIEKVNPLRLLSGRSQARLMRLLYDFKPFLETAVDVNYPATLNLFFSGHIYRRLKGNPFVGYLFDQGVALKSNRIKLEIDAPPGLEKYADIFRDILEHHNQDLKKRVSPFYHLNFAAPAPDYTLHIHIVDVNPERSSKLIPSLTLEMALEEQASRKSFYIRFSTGHAAGLFEAIQLAVKRIFINLHFLRQKVSP